MNFGQAVEALKEGKLVARAGWNGKKMYIVLNKGSYPNLHIGDVDAEENGIKGVALGAVGVGRFIEGLSPLLFEKGSDGTVPRLPNLNMRAATGSTVTGWLASQTDILAEDWEIVGIVSDTWPDKLPTKEELNIQGNNNIVGDNNTQHYR